MLLFGIKKSKPAAACSPKLVGERGASALKRWLGYQTRQMAVEPFNLKREFGSESAAPAPQRKEGAVRHEHQGNILEKQPMKRELSKLAGAHRFLKKHWCRSVVWNDRSLKEAIVQQRRKTVAALKAQKWQKLQPNF